MPLSQNSALMIQGVFNARGLDIAVINTIGICKTAAKTGNHSQGAGDHASTSLSMNSRIFGDRCRLLG
jgi:hypothetical protein